jgi:hypothetical protein
MEQIAAVIESFPERIRRLLLSAQRIADGTPGFFRVKGPGAGDHAANEYMRTLRELAKKIFGSDMSEKLVCPGLNYRFDFYFAEESTVVEFAFGLHNPQSEFEKDIFKCLLARDRGCRIDRLLFVAKPGGELRLGAPGQKAVSEFVQRKFDLNVGVWELVDSAVA